MPVCPVTDHVKLDHLVKIVTEGTYICTNICICVYVRTDTHVCIYVYMFILILPCYTAELCVCEWVLCHWSAAPRPLSARAWRWAGPRACQVLVPLCSSGRLGLLVLASPFFKCWDGKCVSPCPICLVPRIKVEVSCNAGQALYHQSYIHCPLL